MQRLYQRIENYNKAFNLFKKVREEYIKDKGNDTFKLAITQSFEIVFELAWKVLKDYMQENGLNVNYPKEVIKEAFNMETIKNGQIWIDMLNTKNLSAHEYNEEKINPMLERIAYDFYGELSLFSEQIKAF